MPHPAHTVAHRGYWNTEGAAQNSRTALRKAIEAGMYGVETDIWLNADGELFINHDPSFNGVTIKNATSYQCENLTLGNGEKMPRLSDFFNIMKEKGGKTILVIEIKDHGSDALNKAAASAAVKAVRESGLRDRCEYISFSSVACEQVVKDDPEAKVAYLSGDKSPAELHEKGYTGIDYHQNVITSHPEWVEEAHRLGMTVNVWTVNGTEDMMKLCSMGVDLITTDNPVAASLLEKYLEDNK
ncbi:MAG: glycerophosphodiester phosphodiesterase [Prevotella sp. AG:487_50_53]|nr:MAG: glycerophosphodiester phosphodiesterase [Prevotella sp. AG:487_50_53]